MSYIFTCVSAPDVADEKFEMAMSAAVPEVAKVLYDYDVDVSFTAPDKIEITSLSDVMPLSLEDCKEKLKWIFIDGSTSKTYPEFRYVKTEDTLA